MQTRHTAPAGTLCDYCDDAATACFIEQLQTGSFSYRVCDPHAFLFTSASSTRELAFSFVEATREEHRAGKAFRDSMRDVFRPVVTTADYFGASIEALTEDRFCDLPMSGDPAPYRRAAERARIYGAPDFAQALEDELASGPMN